MNLFLKGVLKITESPEPFKDENGVDVSYHINTIKDEEGRVLVVNSKDSYEQFEGKTGIFRLKARPMEDAFKKDGSAYRGLLKLSLQGFTETEEIIEEHIA